MSANDLSANYKISSCQLTDAELLCTQWLQDTLNDKKECGIINSNTYSTIIEKGEYYGNDVIVVEVSFSNGVYNNGSDQWFYYCDGTLIEHCVSFSTSFYCEYNTDVQDYFYNNPHTQIWECLDGTPSCVCYSTANTYLATYNVTTSSANLKFEYASGFLQYKWRYRIENTNSWTETTSTQNNKSVFGLSKCDDYEWQVKAKCPNDIWTVWLGPKQFKTECSPCYTTPNYQLSTNNISQSNATLYINISSFIHYEWRYRSVGNSWINLGNTNSQNFYLSNLDECTDYEWQMKGQCQNNTWTEWLGPNQFKTECSPCYTTPNYQLSTNSITDFSTNLHIDLLNFKRYAWQYKKAGTSIWSNPIESSINTISIDELTKCTNYQWRVRVQCENDMWTEWLGNALFSTLCESVCDISENYILSSSNITTSTVNLSVNLNGFKQYEWKIFNSEFEKIEISNSNSLIIENLSDCTNYQWAIRLECLNGEKTDWLGEEEFKTECSCFTPDNYDLSANNISKKTAQLNVNFSDFKSYKWQYKIKGATNWNIPIVTLSNYLNIQALLECTSYQWQISIQCDNDYWSEWLGIGEFKTTCDDGCYVPNEYELSVNDISQTTANLKINFSGFDSYIWRYRKAGTQNWSNDLISDEPNYNLSDLSICTYYEWQMRVECNNQIKSSWIGIGEFTTKCATSSIQLDEKDEIILSPNPCRDQLFIKTKSPINSIVIRDIYGKAIHQKQGMKINKIDVSFLSSGTYILECFSTKKIYNSIFTKQ